MSQNQVRQTIYSVQFLRFLAAFMVVVLHSNNRAGWTHPDWDRSWLYWLASGVDIFFVISGFIMAYIIKPDEKPFPFLWRRIWRIVPLYWIVTVAGLLLSLAFPLYFWRDATLEQMLWSMAFLTFHQPLVGVGWTLEYEMFFYLVIALCLFSRQWAFWAAIILLAAMVVASGLGGAKNTPTWWLTSGLVILEFLMGIAVYYATRRISLNAWLGLAIGALGLMTLALVEGQQALRGLIWGVPAALIVFGFVKAEPVFAKAWARPFVFLGDASYAIYLGHFVALAVAGRLLSQNLFGYRATEPSVYLTIAILVCVGLLAGILLHLCVERPLISIERRLRGDRSHIATVPI